MKRLLSTLSMIIACLAIHAYDFESGPLAYTILSAEDMTVEVSKCIDDNAKKLDAMPLTIPETVEYNGTKYTVISIGEESLTNLQITELTIPRTIQAIKFAAFRSTQNIARLNITDLEAWCRILYNHWNTCPMTDADLYLNGEKVKNLVIPESITEINPHAFVGCKSIQTVTMSDNVTSIGADAFSSCYNITSITLSKNLKYLGDGTFWGCEKIKTLTLPKTLEYFGGHALIFTNLSKLEVESGCANYDSRNDCNAVIDSRTNIMRAGCKNTVIPDGVVALGDSCFFGCGGLKNVVVPHSVEAIGVNAFEDCDNLKSITLTNNIKHIGWFGSSPGTVNMDFVDKEDFYNYLNKDDLGAYFYQPNLEFVTRHYYIDGKLVTEIKDLPASMTTIKNYALCNGLDVKNIELGPGVTELGIKAFFGCADLQSITIPASLKTTDGSCFTDCTSLKRVNISDLKAWCNIAFAVEDTGYDSESNPLRYDADLYLNGEKVVNLVIPDGLTKLGDAQFVHCNSINTVTFPNSMKELGIGTFQNCKNLQTINFSPAMTKVSQLCFKGCGFTSLTLPKHIVELEDDAFSYCSNLTTVDTGDGVRTIDKGVFEFCDKLTSISLGSATQSVDWWLDNFSFNVTSITCRRATPQTKADYSTFNNQDYTLATLYVPASALEKYKQTYPWSEFTNIKAIGSSGIEGVTIDASDANGNGAAPCYDLVGRRITGTPHGLVIQQGKKIVLSK